MNRINNVKFKQELVTTCFPLFSRSEKKILVFHLQRQSISPVVGCCWLLSGERMTWNSIKCVIVMVSPVCHEIFIFKTSDCFLFITTFFRFTFFSVAFLWVHHALFFVATKQQLNLHFENCVSHNETHCNVARERKRKMRQWKNKQKERKIIATTFFVHVCSEHKFHRIKNPINKERFDDGRAERRRRERDDVDNLANVEKQSRNFVKKMKSNENEKNNFLEREFLIFLHSLSRRVCVRSRANA